MGLQEYTPAEVYTQLQAAEGLCCNKVTAVM